MGKQPLALRPILEFQLWKNSVHCSDDPLGPPSLCLRVHLIFDHFLRQAVDVEALVLGIALDESESARFLDGLNPGKRFRNGTRNRLTAFFSAMGEISSGMASGARNAQPRTSSAAPGFASVTRATARENVIVTEG
jgi:hypothetical protein